MMIRLFCIQTYHGHWAGHSGYHHFLKYLDADLRLDHRRIERGKVARDQLQGAERLLFPVLARLAGRRANPWATERDLLEEWRLFGEVKKCLAAGEKVVVHFMDGEVGFNFFGTLCRRLDGKERGRLGLVATYHQPASVLGKIFPRVKRAADLDLILTVGPSQFPYFDSVADGNISFVPHGVDTDFFRPAPLPEDGETTYCITVGQWLRDFDALERTIRKAPGNMVFRLVAIPESLKLFERLPNVEIFSGINDEALRRLYQESHVGLMPLEDSTANNGLLEMMACGMPIIVTRVGSVEDYVTENCSHLLNTNDPDEILRAIGSLADSPRTRELLGSAARRRAEEFSFARMGARMSEVYRSALPSPDDTR